MSGEQLKMLDSYIKSGMSPILLENIPAKVFEGAIILESDCDNSLLNGHYDGMEFKAPEWYEKLIQISKENHAVLLIDNINKISKEEQTKFIEIFKYKKVSTFDLPKNCTIIVTCSNLKERPINEEVYSLMAHI